MSINKVLVVVNSFNDYGGIINHTENLITGLKEIGKEVNFVFLKPTKSNKKKLSDFSGINYSIGEGTNLPVHLGRGWLCEHYSYLDNHDIKRFIDLANNHDLVIWESLFGFKNKSTINEKRWTKMITDVESKQIALIHDGNMKKLYPWIYKFRKNLNGLACVHPSAYKSSLSFNIPVAMILNPQKIDPLPKKVEFSEKDGIFSLQTFKKWKHVDDLILASPYINTKVSLAGDGIERRYMCSDDK